MRRRMKDYSNTRVYVQLAWYVIVFLFSLWMTYDNITEDNAAWSWLSGVMLMSMLWGVSQVGDELDARMREGR